MKVHHFGSFSDEVIVKCRHGDAILLQPPQNWPHFVFRQDEIAVSDGGLGPLPAAVEVAAYRIVAEALTNTVRHAGASNAGVCLCATDGALRVEVADDGSGLGADVESGVGLRSMRERALELGGRVEVACPSSGGTVVTATLPIAGAAGAAGIAGGER